jgi:pilus assembly protein CpaB
MKWSVVGLALLGIAAAICAAVLMASWGGRPGTVALPGNNQGQRITVLVAGTDLPALSAVPDNAVAKTAVAQNLAPVDSYSEPVQVVGKVLAVPMTKGQAFTAAVFAPRGSGWSLAAELPEGKRAVMVTLANAGSLGGLLYPGARVDVLASFSVESGSTGRAVSTTLLQSVEVLAVEGETIATEPISPSGAGSKLLQAGTTAALPQNIRITLLLDPKQAQELQVANAYGSISLALRNPHDSAEEIRQSVMLLKEGHLATGSGEGLVVGPPQVQPPPTTITPAQSPKSAQTLFDAKPSGQQWDVTVLRGSAAEVHSFPVLKGSHVGGDNDVRN